MATFNIGAAMIPPLGFPIPVSEKPQQSPWLKKTDKLSPESRLMVAMYERAMEDWIGCATGTSGNKWDLAVDAVDWILSDNDPADANYFPFLFICAAH
jgi:hypothetical protein